MLKDLNLKQYAKGKAQLEIVKDLEKNKKTDVLRVYMKTEKEYTGYIKSFRNLYGRLKSHGIKVKWQKGKNGGDWSAYMILEE